MKKKLLLIAITSTISIQSFAEYIIKINVGDSISKIGFAEVWNEPYTEIGEWTNFNDIYGCGQWNIEPSSIAIGVVFDKERVCSQEQKRVLTTYEKSNKDNIRVVGEPVEEIQTISANETISDTGTRYNNSFTIGRYYVWNLMYYGYFSNSYVAGSGAVTYNTGNLSVKSYKGYTIDHIVTSGEGSGITMRLLPTHGYSGLKPIITINGERCTLIGPSQYSAYDAACNFDLHLKFGSVLNIDIEEF